MPPRVPALQGYLRKLKSKAYVSARADLWLLLPVHNAALVPTPVLRCTSWREFTGGSAVARVTAPQTLHRQLEQALVRDPARQ